MKIGMETKLSPLKIVVLIVFVGLVGGFVSYRSGMFDSPAPAQDTTAVVPVVKPDSLEKDTAEMTIMPGSKMMVLPEKVPGPEPVKEVKEKKRKEGGENIDRGLAPSSKSGAIFHKEDFKEKETGLDNMMMSGSKSGILIPVKKDTTPKK